MGFDPEHYTAQYLRSTLSELERAGLIITDRARATYKISPRWPLIQEALDLSLSSLMSLSARSLIVEPFLGPPDPFVAPAAVFVAMPFTEALRPVWEDHIQRAVTALNLSVARADDFFTSHAIMSDVWSALYHAQAIVADCTGRNPNVFYEIGLAHVIGRPVILITQSADDVPFDLRSYRYIHYEFTPRGMQEFEQKLVQTLRSVIPTD
jgi:hypothetical protein